MADETTVQIGADIKEAEEGLGTLGSLFEGLAPIVAGFAAGATTAVLAFAVAVGKEAVDSAMRLDTAVKNLGKQTGASTTEMGQYKSIIKDLYVQGLGEDFDELAANLTEVKKQTDLSGDALKNFTKHATAFGSTFDTDVSENTRAAKMMMDQFGISSDEAFNLMTQGMQKGLNKNDDLLDSINEYSVHFKNMGFSSEEMFNIFKNGAENGAFSIDKVGDAMKEFSIQMMTGSDNSKEAMKELGFDTGEMFKRFSKGGPDAQTAMGEVVSTLGKVDNKTKQNKLGVALFGTMWEDLGPKATKQLVNIAGGFDKSKKSADKLLSADYGDIGEAFEGIKRQIEVGFLIPLGDALLPVINLFAGLAQKALPPLMKMFGKISGIIKDAFGPEVEKIFNALVEQFDALGLSGDSLSALNPIFEEIKSAIGSMAKTWGKYIMAIIAQIPAFVGYLKTIAPVIIAMVTIAIKVFAWLYNAIVGNITALIPYVSAGFSIISTIISTAMSVIKDIISIVTAVIDNDWATVWAKIKNIFSTVIGAIKKIATTLFSAIGKFITYTISKWKAVFSAYWSFIKAIWGGALTFIKNLVSKVFSLIVGYISTKMKAAKMKISSMWSAIKTLFSRGLAKAYEWGKNLLNSFARGINNRIAALKKKVRGAVNGIKNLLGFGSPTKEGPGRSADTWAPNLMGMYIKGINDNIPKLKNTVSQAAGIVNDGLTFMPHIKTSNAANNGTVNLSAAVLNDQTLNLLTQRIARILTRGGI
jgi:phage-related minor tail protein